MPSIPIPDSIPNPAMTSNAAHWNAKHRVAAHEPASEPAEFVRELLPLLPLGPALDLACGTGRHALFLASRHQPVTAVDFSAAAMEILERRAHDAHFAVTHSESAATIPHRRQGIHLWHADLEAVSLPSEAFSLVLCVNYLQRSLFPQIENTLVPGGILLFETYTVAQLDFEGGPRNPDYLLEVGELRMAFHKLRNLFYRELRAGKGIASLIAQKPAN